MNFSLLGLDFLHFIPTVSTQNNDVITSACAPATLIVVVVAWTLSLEIVFYAFAPIIKRMSFRKILSLWSVSLSLKIYLLFVGKPDPWNYRFFPAELCFFLTGTVLARVKINYNLKVIKSLKFLPPIMPAITIGYFILATRLFSHLTSQDWPVIIAGAVIIFLITQTSNMPDIILLGELSYPIYLCHFFVLSALQKSNLFQSYDIQVQYLLLLSSTLVVSFLLTRLYVPVNKVRKRFV